MGGVTGGDAYIGRGDDDRHTGLNGRADGCWGLKVTTDMEED